MGAVIMRPYDLAFVILGGSQGLRERSLTSVAEEVVVAHTDLPSLINASNLGEKKRTCPDGSSECD